MNRYRLHTLPAGIRVDDTHSGMRCMYDHSGTWLHGDLKLPEVHHLIRRHLAGVEVSTNRGQERLVDRQLAQDDVRSMLRSHGINAATMEGLYTALAVRSAEYARQYPDITPEACVSLAVGSLNI